MTKGPGRVGDELCCRKAKGSLRGLGVSGIMSERDVSIVSELGETRDLVRSRGRGTWHAGGQAPRQPPRSGACRLRLVMRTAKKVPRSCNFTAPQNHTPAVSQSLSEPCAWQAELLRKYQAPVLPPGYGASRMKRTVRTGSAHMFIMDYPHVYIQPPLLFGHGNIFANRHAHFNPELWLLCHMSLD